MHLHHVQLVVPAGETPAAVAFYRDVIGMQLMEKPAGLAGRAGAWLRFDSFELHLAEVDDFVPAARAHPGIRVADLDTLANRFIAAGYRVEPDDLFPGHRRFYVRDPFGNRLEFMAPLVSADDAIVVELDPGSIGSWIDDAVDVYRRAFTIPPYERSEGQVVAFREALRHHVDRTGFVGFGCRVPDDTLAGFTYGYSATAGQWWRDQVAEALGDMADEWLENTFEYVELAVDPRYQRLGIGRRLHDALMGAQSHPIALLTTLDDITAGRRLYESAGWHTLASNFRFARSTARYVVMGWRAES